MSRYCTELNGNIFAISITMPFRKIVWKTVLFVFLPARKWTLHGRAKKRPKDDDDREKKTANKNENCKRLLIQFNSFMCHLFGHSAFFLFLGSLVAVELNCIWKKKKKTSSRHLNQNGKTTEWTKTKRPYKMRKQNGHRKPINSTIWNAIPLRAAAF